MNSIKRKNILHAAKQSIKAEIILELDTVQHDIACEMSKEEEDRNLALLDSLREKAQELTEAYNNFGKSKRAKKKASIEWSTDDVGNVPERQKPTKSVSDWDAVHRVKENHRKSLQPRAGDWLQEGGLVVVRGSAMPMMVLTVRSNGVVEVLAGGQTRLVRDLSLRPAFDEE